MALKLRKAGFEDAVALQGGFEAWAKLGLPMEFVEALETAGSKI